MSAAESTIPAEVVELHIPNIEHVVLMGGAVLELAGIRPAEDIDMVMSIADRQVLYQQDPEKWQKIIHTYRRSADNSKIQITSLSDTLGRFDIWSHWYDEARAKGNRHVPLEELLENSTQHPAGFYVANLDYVIDMKRGSSRLKDIEDIELVETMIRTGRLKV